MRFAQRFLLLVVAGVLGCDSTSAPPKDAVAPAAPPAPAAQAPPPAPAPQATVTKNTADEVLGVDAPNQRGAHSDWAITRVLVTNYFGVREDVTMGQVKQAYAMFEAEKGYKPKTKEEGMAAIQHIQLPELPDDTYWYEYDPVEHELMVFHKEPAPGK
jgi:hypothetical protein